MSLGEKSAKSRLPAGRAIARIAGRYLLAVVAAIITLAATQALFAPLGGVFFALPIAAVTVVALVAGLGPGLLATALLALGLALRWLAPSVEISAFNVASSARLASFVIAALPLCAIAARQRIIQRRLDRERAAATEAATALRETSQALRDADRRKDEFLAMLSHELRNPLAPIHNGLYLLRRSTAGDERASKTVAIIDRQVSHLTRLIDDLLDVTRISRGKIKLQRSRLELSELVQHTVDDYQNTFAERGIGLSSEVSTEKMWVDGDATRVAQVIGNLLHNAAKFTPIGGKVAVTLRRSGASRAVIGVADTGVGIEAAMLEKVFEPFTQADRSLDRTRGGLGLGLALVKGLVELHGGQVHAFSEGPGRGARFAIELPLEQQPCDAAIPSLTQERAQARTVLLIEDNRDAADTMREALALRCHRVEVAYDGPQGLAKARELRPDVVLCDIGLPGMDGYAVARAMRSDQELRAITLVAVTGYTQPEDQKRAAEAGFEQHIAKPASLEALERVIAQAPALRG